jgi:hypothetical protein
LNKCTETVYNDIGELVPTGNNDRLIAPQNLDLPLTPYFKKYPTIWEECNRYFWNNKP